MEDDADGVPVAGPDATDAVPQIDPVIPPRASDWPMMHGENHRIALAERDNLGPRLHAWPLLRQDELAAVEIAPRLRQQYCRLQREGEVAVKILMQAVVVARPY